MSRRTKAIFIQASEHIFILRMESYLKRLAQLFFTEYNTQVSQFTFVFPNRRAGLFFRKYLGEVAGKPILAPDFYTINQCFEMLSDMRQADRIDLLFRLYHIYIQKTKSTESFDKFVFWGEMLLSDFNEIDTYMVNAKQLFTNLTDLKKLDDTFDYLTDEQIKAIQLFWTDFSTGNKDHTGFLYTWQHLYDIYSVLKNVLIAEKCGYQGLIHRRLIEQLRNDNAPQQLQEKNFIFIGFNALTPCEKALMQYLQKAGKADFYWDYEAAEVQDAGNRASLFQKENQRQFPSKLTLPVESSESLSDKGKRKQIYLKGVPSAIGQTDEIFRILKDMQLQSNADLTQTAIVLPNENLLQPLLHSLPDNIDKVNVTMGYPLRNTPIFGLMEHIFSLQAKKRTSKNGQASFYHKCVQKILNHQYVYELQPDLCKSLSNQIITQNMIYVPMAQLQQSELLTAIFKVLENTSDALDYIRNILELLQKSYNTAEDGNDNKQAEQIDSEYIYQYYITVNRLHDIIKTRQTENIQTETIFLLLKELTQSVTIPFVGEPLNGLQIMGTLETRGLDFKHLIISSMNEGVFPKKQNANSFIPYNLRRGFGLPTYEQQDAIFAYNFYRLIHHAENIYFLYDSRTEGSQTGEVSRFIHQLRYQYQIEILEETAGSHIHINKPEKLEIKKDESVLKQLDKYATPSGRCLSASALNTYLDCPLHFYLAYVKSYSEADEVQESIESNMFGTILHAAMENIYNPYKNRQLQADTIKEIRKDNKRIKDEVARAYTQNYLKITDNTIHYPEGSHKLIANVMEKYVKQLLLHDEKHTPFTFVAAELDCRATVRLENGKEVNIKGFIDRIDEKDNIIRIIDYKTGNGGLTFKDKELSDVFDATLPNRPKYVLQTFLYALLYGQPKDKVLETNIFYIRDSFKSDYDTRLHCCPDKKTNDTVTNVEDYMPAFRKKLTELLEEIFSSESPFTQCVDTKHCEYCPFTELCHR